MDALLTILIPLLIHVESSGNPNAVGDGGKAVGILQIHKCVVDDVNRIYGKKGFHYEYDDRVSPHVSRDICRLYLTHYGKAYEKKTGKKATMEALARIWNGGPDGWKKQSTIKYWEKVKGLYEQQAEKD